MTLLWGKWSSDWPGRGAPTPMLLELDVNLPTGS